MRLTKSFFLLFLLTLFAFSQQANAGFLLEPYAGFAIGSGERGSNIDYDYNTLQLGGRVGYQMLGFMGGIDYSMASGFDLERETTSAGTTSTANIDTDKSQLGVFVGYDFPILLRAWATYYLSAKADLADGVASEYSGSGTALGVGFTGLPFLSINLEYRMLSYDEFEDNTPSSGTLSPNADLNEIFLSVSLPLDL